jgi:NAD+ diphosphatase
MIPTLDRSEVRRADSSALSAALVAPRSRFVLFRGDRVCLRRGAIDPVICTGEQLRELGVGTAAAVLLGYDGETAWFALDVEKHDSGEPDNRAADERILRQGEFVALGPIQEPVEVGTWALLSQARALLAWNRTSTHCPTCGATASMRAGGHLRVCSDPECGHTQFPRTDPAIIVRVLAEDRCLLARQPRFLPGMRSVIAGFVEPGESLEGCVRREVGEEVGLEVGDVRYLGSQPWPFPMSLMVAFEAHARSEEIRIDGDELEAADWYTRDRALHEVNEGRLVLPSRKSIARRMIDGWLAGRPNL